MDYEAKKKKAQFDWIYKAEERHNNELIFRAPKMIKDADAQLLQRREIGQLKQHIQNLSCCLGDERPSEIDNWAYKAKNAVIFEPEAVAPTLREFMDSVKNDGAKIINRAATRIDTSTIQWKDVS